MGQYGCVMARLVTGDSYTDITKIIDPADLTGNGFDKEPHVTLLYGLHEEVTIAEVKQCLRDVAGGGTSFLLNSIKITGVSLFENPDTDVLKLTVELTDELRQINRALSTLPNTNKYPDYIPHVTLAYLKPGLGHKYAINRSFELVLPVGFIEFSQPNGFKSIVS